MSVVPFDSVASPRNGIRRPNCGSRDNRVTDSRPSRHAIRRRRACDHCEHRFTTYETMVLRAPAHELLGTVNRLSEEMREVQSRLQNVRQLIEGELFGSPISESDDDV